MLSKRTIISALGLFLLALSPAHGQVTPSITVTPTSVNVGHFYEVELNLENGAEVSRDVSYQLTLPVGHRAYLHPDSSNVECSATEVNGRDIEWQITGGLDSQTVGVSVSFLQVNSSCTIRFLAQASQVGAVTLTPGLSVLGVAQSAPSVDVNAADLGLKATFRPLGALATGDTATLIMDLELGATFFIAPFSITLPDELMFLETAPRVTCAVMSLDHSLNPEQNTLSFTHGALSANDNGATCSVEMDVRATSPGTGLIETSTLNKGTALIFGSSFLFQPQPVDLGTAVGVSTITDTDLIFSLNADPMTVEPGNIVELTYSILGTERGAEYTNITLSHDLSAQLPSATFGAINGISGCTSDGISNADGTTLSLSNLAANAGTSCDVTVSVNLPANLDEGTYSVSANLSAETDEGSIVKTANLPLAIAASLVGRIETADTLLLPNGNYRFSISLTHPTGIDNGSFLIQNLLALSNSQDIGIENAQNCDPTLGINSYLNNPELFLNAVTLTAETPCTFDVVGPWINTVSTGDHEFIFGQFNATNQTLTPLNQVTLNSPKQPDFRASIEAGDTQNQLSIVYEFDTSPNGGDVPAPETSNIAFTHDLNGLIPNVTAQVSDGDSFCGPGSQASITNGVLTVVVPILAENSSCALNVALAIPTTTIPGIYTNETSSISYDLSGESFTRDALLLSYTHPGVKISVSTNRDRISAGDTIEYQISLSNESQTNAIEGISVIGNASGELSFSEVSPTLWCGGSSTMSVNPGFALLSSGSLAPGESCSFTLTYQVSEDANLGPLALSQPRLSAISDGNPFSQEIPLPPVNIVDALIVDQSFTKPSIGLNDETTLVLTLDNQSGLPLDSVSTTLPINSFLTGLQILPTTLDNCGNDANLTISQDNEVELSNAGIAVDSACTIRIPLTSGADIPAVSEGTVVTTVSYNRAERSFSVESVPLTLKFQQVELALTWSDIAPGETGTLTASFTRRGSGLTGADIDFVLDTTTALPGLNLTLLETASCGDATIDVSDGILRIRRMTLAQDTPCLLTIQTQIGIDVLAGTYEMTTGPLNANGEPLLAGQETALTVVYRPLNASMSALPLSFPEQSETRVTIDIDNSASAIDALGTTAALSLPMGLSLVPASSETDCGSGVTVTETTPQSIQFDLGSITGGVMCSLSFTLKATRPGELLVNEAIITAHTGTVSSNAVTLDASIVPAVLSVSLDPTVLFVGQQTTVNVGINNQGSGAVVSTTEVTVDFPQDVELVNGTDVQSTCADLTSIISDGSVQLLNSGIPAFEVCQSTFSLETTEPGEATINAVGFAAPHGPFADLSTVVYVEPAPTHTLTTNVADAILEGESFTVVVEINNTSTRLSATEVALALEWDENLVPTDNNLPSSTCELAVDSFAPTDREVRVVFGDIPASSTCVLEFDMTASTPFSGNISLLGIEFPSGTTAPEQLTVPISKRPLSSSLSVTPQIGFVGTDANLVVLIDNTASNATAEDVLVQLDMGDARFAEPTDYMSTCTDLELVLETDSRAAVGVPLLAPGQRCELDIRLAADFIGTSNLSVQVSDRDTQVTTATIDLNRESGPTGSIIFEPAANVIEDSEITTIFQINNPATTLPIENVVVDVEWSSNFVPAQDGMISSECEITTGTLDIETRTGRVILPRLEASERCQLALMGEVIEPGSVVVSIVDITSSAGVPSAPITATLEVAQRALSTTMTLQPEEGFQGQAARLSLVFDNSASAAPAMDVEGFLAVNNGAFPDPLVWESTCETTTIESGEMPSSRVFTVETVPANGLCELTMTVSDGLLGETTVSATVQSDTSATSELFASFTREPAPRLDASLSQGTVELGESVILSVELENLSGRLTVENAMYSIASNGSPHVLETVTVGCEGTAEADEALSILVPSIAPSTRCVAEFSVTPSETGTVELQIGPGSSDAGTFAEQNLILEVLPAVAIEPDGGMNEMDVGIADGGVDGPDAARPPVMMDDNSGCDCAQSSDAPTPTSMWALLALAGLIRVRRQR